MLFSVSASADYYRYIDKDGNVHYTDDLTNVPESQRTDINEYTGYQNDTNDQEKDGQKEETPHPSLDTEQLKNKSNTNELSEIKKRLDQEKKKLEEEYRALMEEKKEITENKGKYRSKSKTKEYNKVIVEFNQKIADYEKRKNLLNKEVKEYNERVKKSYSNALKKGEKGKEEN
jgi:hypothetical protein